MPELPEVETIKRIIKPQIAGQSVISVEVLNAQVIAYPAENDFVQRLSGQTIKSMSRRGKYLSVDFENGDRLFLHLRMTGQLLVTPADYDIEKHTHMLINLSSGEQIRYIDVRRFGRFWYLKDGEDISITGIDKLGLEPTSKNLTDEYLKDRLRTKNKPIKEMLHDQSVVAGIGNIYSDEILFASGIYPEKKCSNLTDNDWKKLAEKIPEIIKWGIEKNKMTAEEYLEGKGKEYRNTPHLRVYGHAGKACPNCGTTFEKITVGGRTSIFCSRCQNNKGVL